MSSDTKKNKQCLQKKETKKTKVKKIGFLSGVAFIISSVIGVGIFLKNGQILDFNLGNFTLSLLAWILTSLAVIALGLSLLVIAAKTNSELGILQWAKDFVSPFLYQVIKSYLILIYIPLIVTGDAFYFVQSIQQGFPTLHLHWYVPWIIVISALVYFSITNMLAPKMAVIHSNIAFYIKLIPIIFFAFIAFILYGINYDHIQDSSHFYVALNSSSFIKPDLNDITGLYYSNPMLMYGPEIGFFASIPAMFFAFDGFYYVISIRKFLKEPKKAPSIILVGIICVVIIFLLITISLIISTNNFQADAGMVTGVKYLSSSEPWRIVNSILNITISIGCLGILSSSINFSSALYYELALSYDLPFFCLFKKRFHCSFRTASRIYLFSYLSFTVFVVALLGTFGFINLDSYNFGTSPNDRIDSLYSFINTITNWESLFTFTNFVFIIGGSWFAMKEKKITIQKKRKKIAFIFESVFAFFVILFAVLFAITDATGNLIFVCEHNYFFNESTNFYSFKNFVNTYIELSNHEVYVAKLVNNNLVWTNTTTNQVLALNQHIQVIKVWNKTNVTNQYLLGLIFNNNDWINKSILSNEIINSQNLKVLVNGVFKVLDQDFIAQIINFLILLAIISICVIYGLANKRNVKKYHWFNLPNNIYYNKELEIHL